MNSLFDKKIIVVTHASISPNSGTEVYGQAWALADYLREKCQGFLFIRHPLDGRYASRIEYRDEGKSETGLSKICKVSGVLRYILDTVQTILWTIQKNRRWDVYIGVNGINTLAGFVLKKLGFVTYLIFYTADYVPKRFENNLLNSVYHWVDKIGIKNADYIWNISMKQVEIRRQQGVPDNKNKHVPHGAKINKIIRPDIDKVDTYSLVLAANLVAAINYKLIFDIFKKIVKKTAEAKLYIVGSGEKEIEMRNYAEQLQLKNKVIFKGNMPNDELLKFLPCCGVGIAVYTNTCSWTEFSDSFKIKEYLACGCPVIAYGATAAIEESIDSGAVFPITAEIEDTIEVVERLFKDKKFYTMCRVKAIRFMEKLDWSCIYSQQLAFLDSGR